MKEFLIEVFAKSITIPQVNEFSDIHKYQLTWNVIKRTFNTPIIPLHKSSNSITFNNHLFGKILAKMKLDPTGDKFHPKNTIFRLKDGETNENIAIFDMDLSVYTTKMY